MSQNSARIPWKEAELQKMLSDIMNSIRDRRAEYGGVANSKRIDYVRIANTLQKVMKRDASHGVV
jgi:glutamate dehydrogenase (NADP+)